MISSSFLSDPRTKLIADASVIINLNATLCAAEIIRAFKSKLYVTENACVELEQGSDNGHRDYVHLLELLEDGLVRRVFLDAKSLPTYESLIGGATLVTLDDGEAATIAYAATIGGVALIDERKASSLCKSSFPNLSVRSTVAILLHATVRDFLGPDRQAAAIANALMKARMRVSAEYLDQVKRLIGEERAACCPSLPKSVRLRHS